MSKERKTVTLDPEVKAYLDAEGRNASETVNKLVKMDMGGEAVNEELLKMRMEMEEDRYHESAQKARGHLERYNQLKERLEKRQEKEEQNRKAVIVGTAEKVKPQQWFNSGSKESQLPGVEHQAYQTHAKNTDMTPQELRTEVVDYILSEESNE